MDEVEIERHISRGDLQAHRSDLGLSRCDGLRHLHRKGNFLGAPIIIEMRGKPETDAVLKLFLEGAMHVRTRLLHVDEALIGSSYFPLLTFRVAIAIEAFGSHGLLVILLVALPH